MLSAFAGGRVFGERLAEGPARVLALHGWGRSRRDFATSLAGLPAVALDLPGFGSSPPPETAWGSADYAALVAVVAEQLVAEHAAVCRPAGGTEQGLVVVGHSFGGCVAVQLATTRPDLVGSLVLSGVPRLVRPATAQAGPRLAYRAVRRLRVLGLVSEQRLERARNRHGSPDYRAADGVMRQVFVHLVGENLEAEVRGLSCPLELIWGESDTEVPPAAARRVAQIVPGSRLEVLAGIGHLLPLEAPEALRAAVQAAVARLACPA
jgi:pimeloyl-ACP methyl ester carboxylesterase